MGRGADDCRLVFDGLYFWRSLLGANGGLHFSYQYDKRMYHRFDIPPWFLELRFRLTSVVVATQVLMFVIFHRAFTLNFGGEIYALFRSEFVSK